MENSSEQLTKKQRRELKKQQQQEQRQSKHKKEKTKKFFIWGGIIIAVLLLFVFIFNRNSSTETNDTTWKLGSENPKIVLTEYSDLQCPACEQYVPLVKKLLQEFPDDLQLKYKHFPLTSIHPHALEAAHAAEAAGNQGFFWDMHDMLFDKQSEWSPLEDPTDTFISYAETIGLNKSQFVNDLNSSAVKSKVRQDRAEGIQKGVNSTPSFFIGDVKIQNPSTYEEFKKFIELELSLLPEDTIIEDTTHTDVHVHADFKVYIDNQPFDFTGDEFQSTDENPKHEFTHLHDGNGEIIHRHADGVTIGDFFTSIGFNISDECITTNDGTQRCNTNEKTLKVFVNDKQIAEPQNYQFEDLDRILVTYGADDVETLNQQLASVTDEACIYSLSCPERGTPPTESCVGGLGTNCSAPEDHDN